MALTENQITRYQTCFNRAFVQGAADANKGSLWGQLAGIGTRIPSTKGVEDYRWLGGIPAFQKWVGERKIDQLKDYHYYIQNDRFQAAIRIAEDDLNDDSYGMYETQVRGLPGSIEDTWAQTTYSMLQNEKTAKAFDNVAFFSGATGERKFSNLLTGTISAANPTLDQVKKDVNTARVAMAMYKDDDGKALGIVPDTFIVHPQMEMLFRQLFNSTADVSDSKNSGVANPFAGVGRVIVDPGLTDVNDFYALALNGYSVGPVIRQERDTVRTEMFDDHFKNHCYIYGSDFRGNAGYGFPQLAAKVVSSVA